MLFFHQKPPHTTGLFIDLYLKSPLTVSFVLQQTNSVTLRYTPTPQSTSHFDLYRFQLSDASIPVKEKAANDTETKVTFDGLIPGRLYNITMWTVSQGVPSQPLQRQDRLCKLKAICNVESLAPIRTM